MNGFTRSAASFLSTVLEPLSLALSSRSSLGTVLLYHRVSDSLDPTYPPLRTAEFERHCEFIRRNFTVVPLAELMKRKRKGDSLTGLLAITFDDGYRDFLTNAYPLLKKHSLPSTHYLVSDCLRTGLPTWNLRLKHLGKGPEQALQLAKLPRQERYQWLEEREAGRKVEYPEMLKKDDLTKVDPALVQWESHGLSHGMLPYLNESEVNSELRDSRRELSEWLGKDVTSFSYPNGAYSESVKESVRAAGYSEAFTVEQRRMSLEDSEFAIPRLDVGAIPRAMMASEVSGLNGVLRSLKGG